MYKPNASIWYNKTCRDKKLTPNYTAIKINGNNRQCTNTLRAATWFRLNQETKFLHIKKVPSQTGHRSAAISVHCTKTVYTVKRASEDGRVCRPKHVEQIQIDQ